MGLVRLDGDFEGIIDTEGALSVGSNANILADIKASSATISGKVIGNVYIQCKVELLETTVLI